VDGDDLRLWLSPVQFEDSYLHPAFVNSLGGPLLIGEVLGHLDGSGNLTSDPTEDVIFQWDTSWGIGNGTAYNTTAADWLNDSSGMTEYSGWHVETAWEHRLLTLLMLMEDKTFNLKAQLKGDYIGATAGADDNGNYRGIKTPFLAGYSVDSMAERTGLFLQGFDLGYITAPTDNNQFYNLTGDFGLSYFQPSNYDAPLGIDTFVQGWVDQIGCDIAFAFIASTSGAGTGAEAGHANPNTREQRRNLANTYYNNGPVSIARIGVAGSSTPGRFALRLCKDVS
jgi:hypothetical protein